MLNIAIKSKIAENAVTEYRGLVQQTVATNTSMAQVRKGLDDNAAAYMSNSALFLDSQNKAFKREAKGVMP